MREVLDDASDDKTSFENRFTLMELMLALGLTVLVAALIGYLMQMYIAITEAGDQRIKQLSSRDPS